MDNIFVKEDEIYANGEKLLLSKVFESPVAENHYRALLEEYKKLLKQMRSMVRISDLMQGELNTLSRKLKRISQIDSLTGLYNRRFFNEIYQKEWHGGVRSAVFLSALMVDIDYFKKYNDTYGHLQGDKCLQLVAGALQKAVQRPRDLVARYGGEEFVILLPETALNGAVHIAKMVLANVEALDLVHRASPVKDRVTVSVGAAALIPTGEMPPETLLNLADDALYRAKGDARNCFRECGK
ncbi:diguanylate cyclase [Candidatus Formimonas warabiya]|uniref:GGDEF domain-containing protein n=1 Tax=Formimonas warabiya TaxID=1761012 RepID=A0A3G1KQE6_FORW1|nr:diguanylate cyclase [Candidatus Formimonas warabiya]ATW24660.1 hypothetical protein DCMF_07605 [Candidatus Formimonas warabiya]